MINMRENKKELFLMKKVLIFKNMENIFFGGIFHLKLIKNFALIFSFFFRTISKIRNEFCFIFLGKTFN